MRTLLHVGCFAILVGCSAVPEEYAPYCADGVPINVSLTQAGSRGQYATFRLSNNADCRVSYQHWMGQGPEPVAYCKKDETKTWICSREVYVVGSDEEGWTNWTHETPLDVAGSVRFKFRTSGAKYVGVKFWPPGTADYVFIWARIEE